VNRTLTHNGEEGSFILFAILILCYNINYYQSTETKKFGKSSHESAELLAKCT